MDVMDTKLQGLKVIKLKAYHDRRGFFVERFNEQHFKECGLPQEFKQDNHSRSMPGVIRGLHYQYDPPQGKLVGVLRGAIYDVVVDLRPDSPTYGETFGIELSADNATLLWVPAGFAHGFCVLGNEPADVLYKVSCIYRAQGEAGIYFADPELAIDWPVRHAIVSERDKALPSFAAYKLSPVRWKKPVAA